MLIDDWFKRVITYDFKIQTANVSVLENGKYKVTTKIIADRFESRLNKTDKRIGINEPISIALYNKNSQLLTQKVLFNKSNMTFEFLVNEKPTSIRIDPEITRLDKFQLDNRFLF